MKKEKGFTLIELLAVIVILAILMVIAVPKILNVIEKSERESFIDSIKLIENGIKIQFNSNNVTGEDNFEKSDDGCYLFDFTEHNDNYDKLKIKNKEQYVGIIKYCDNIFLYNEFSNGKYILNTDDDGNKIIDKSNNKLTNLKYIEDDSLLLKYNFDDDGSKGTDVNTNKTKYGLYYNGKNSYSLFGEYNKDTITYETTFMPFEYGIENIITNTENGGCEISIENKKIYGSCYINGSYRKIYAKEELSLFKFYHSALTYDGNNLKLYVNNELQGEYKINSKIGLPEKNTSFMLGANPTGSKPENHYFNGIISSARIYNRAITEEEMENNYNLDKRKYFKSTDIKLDNKIAKNNLLVYYNLNKNIGFDNIDNINTVRNFVSNEYSLTLYNSSVSDKKLKFNGNNSYAKIGDIRPKNVTYEVVFDTSLFNSEQAIISNTESGGCALQLENNIIRTACHINGSYQRIESKAIEKNTKYYVALTYNGNILKLYLNGVLQSQKEISGNIGGPVSGINLMLAYDPNDGHYLNGNIYSVRIYDRGLTENEIANNYNYDINEFNIK